MAIILTATLLAGWTLTRRNEPDALVIFCGREPSVANALVADFEQRTGIRCLVVADSSRPKAGSRTGSPATRRRDATSCGTPRRWTRFGWRRPGSSSRSPPGALRIPETFRAPQQTWAAFAGVRQVWWSPKGDADTIRKQVDAIHAGDDLNGVSILIDAGPQHGFPAWAIEAASGGPDVLGERLRDWSRRGAKVAMKAVSGIPIPISPERPCS